MNELTPETLAELQDAISVAGHRRICEGDRKWCVDDDGDCERAARVAMPAAREALADAWDEGFDECQHTHECRNPYRKADHE